MARPAPLLLCLALTGASSASAREPDPWLGRDKLLHFGISAGLATGGYAGASLLLEDEAPRLLLGGGLALGAGVAKELYDLSGLPGAGTASWRDLTWNALGVAAGLAIAWAIDHFLLAPHRPRPVVQPSGAALDRHAPGRLHAPPHSRAGTRALAL